MEEIDERRVADTFFSKHWLWQIEREELDSFGASPTVTDELARRLPHIARDSWPDRFELGGVYLAGRATHIEARITEPSRLEYYEPKLPLEALASWYPAFSSEWILHRDDDLAIVYKPSRLPTTAARDQRRYTLAEYLSAHFGRPIHLPSRLDTAVSGLLICSLSERMNRYLQKAYERRWLEKYYLAETSSVPNWISRSIDWDIARDPRHPVLRRCVEVGQGQRALTEISRLEGSSHSALLRAKPVTGRTHQIRLHLAREGLPIIGDPYYAGAIAEDLHLVSYAIRFYHPYIRSMLSLELPKELQPKWLREFDTSSVVPVLDRE
jgi:tRNA pseudouridine32 synthase/23S rRNA pseudouridine746 synthase